MSGQIEAYDSDQQQYRSVMPLRYCRRCLYWFRFTVDPATHRYSVHVREEKGPEVTIAARFAFRPPQANVRVLENFGMRMDNTTADDLFSAVKVWDLRFYNVWGLPQP